MNGKHVHARFAHLVVSTRRCRFADCRRATVSASSEAAAKSITERAGLRSTSASTRSMRRESARFFRTCGKARDWLSYGGVGIYFLLKDPTIASMPGYSIANLAIERVRSISISSSEIQYGSEL